MDYCLSLDLYSPCKCSLPEALRYLHRDEHWVSINSLNITFTFFYYEVSGKFHSLYQILKVFMFPKELQEPLTCGVDAHKGCNTSNQCSSHLKETIITEYSLASTELEVEFQGMKLHSCAAHDIWVNDGLHIPQCSHNIVTELKKFYHLVA